MVSDRYRVLDCIARGGMGVVYRAFDSLTGEVIALKRVSSANLGRLQLFVAAFEREYQVLSSLDHPRIVRTFDYGVDADGPYYTMELVAGSDLRRAAPLPWRQACLLLRDVASALAPLHARRLVHRDLTPNNVRLTPEGRGKLLDFGALADFGPAATVVGTPPMIPPEALAGEPLDERSDVYSLGALLYWTVCGRNAYGARSISELEAHWESAPVPPSELVPDVPAALDELVLAMMRRSHLARPASAAEVTARLTSIADLEPDPLGDQRRVAQSFLTTPPFVGRAPQLAVVQERLKRTASGAGSTIRVSGPRGSGRSRFLDEAEVLAQVSGATVVRVDASMHSYAHGTARMIALRVLDALPVVARGCAQPYLDPLSALDEQIAERLRLYASPTLAAAVPVSASSNAALRGWIGDVAKKQRLAILVDNVDHCDDASLNQLAELSGLQDAALLMILAERPPEKSPATAAPSPPSTIQAVTVELRDLSGDEVELLARGIFGDAPHVARFSEWLHESTAGSVLHCLEVIRRLVAQDVVTYEAGLWSLPANRPTVALSSDLEQLLLLRLAGLSADALDLIRHASLLREGISLEVCSPLVDPKGTRTSAQRAPLLLDQLCQHGLLLRTPAGYRFTSAALRDAVAASIPSRARMHQNLGAALEAVAARDPAQLLQAGWHYLNSGEEVRGAELVALAMRDDVIMRKFLFSGARIGLLAEDALRVFRKHGRDKYSLLPLLTTLALAGFFEDRRYVLLYEDATLELLQDLSGLRVARQLSRWLGKHLALPLALLLAWCRLAVFNRKECPYSFYYVLKCLLTAMVPLVGASAVALDAQRAKRITSVIEPLSALPMQSTMRVVYEVCLTLQEVAREQQVYVSARAELLAARLANPRNYPLLPPDARTVLTTAMHFVRGAFAVFRPDTTVAEDAIRSMEQSGIKLYAMVSAHLRALMHTYRGDLAAAERDREEIEAHAARAGTAWQVELWRPAALLPHHLLSDDFEAAIRAMQLLDELVPDAPSLRSYQLLARHWLIMFQAEPGDPSSKLNAALAAFAKVPARSFIGWTAAAGGIAAALNRLGRHTDARDLCSRVRAGLVAADFTYVGLFMGLELQAAHADIALGDAAAARERCAALYERLTPGDNPFYLGLVHEVMAKAALAQGDGDSVDRHASALRECVRRTHHPALVARLERLLTTAQGRSHDDRAEATDGGLALTAVERRPR